MSPRLALALDGPAEAPPLLLLHSLGADRRMWAPQVEALRAERRLLRVELWGHGASPTPPPPHDLAALSAQVLEAVDAAGVGRFDLAGISLGGQLALHIAAEHPERVRTLTAGATAARIGEASGWDARVAAVRAGGMAAIAELALSRLFSPGLAERAPDTYAAAREALLACDPEGYVACCRALRDADLSPLLPHIQAPTLLVAGTLDLSTPPSALRSVGARVREAAVLELEAGHLINLEAPEAFTAALRAQLAG
ncbi:MAG: alpha/beta fold hydrolase [Alphaproteobacteria bacterium]|nr:alpha/beta fold hydrolase [Alphaproteobacteria bacterium]